MRRLRSFVVPLLIGILSVGWSVSYATARSEHDRRPAENRYRAIIRCATFPQEDSAGALELVEYAPAHGSAVAVYRCGRHGF